MVFYNTLGRKYEEFVPICEGKASIYGCGPTVYNYAHIGNLRAYVFQDILKRTLEFLGYTVKHVMNITDVGHLSGDNDEGEDKMLKSAKESGKSVLEIADFYTQAFFHDVDRLNIKRPSIICKATEHIDSMIDLIKKIEANGHTYKAGGNLYFDISTFPDYGKLADINLNDLKAGARIQIDENKRSPYDFVLWFTKSKFENHALQWDSPWGRGYPGWHIECSAMSMQYLGEQFDIHTGGIDHVRIHHTNEIAQSQGATGKKWVNYWLHNEFLVIDKGKMSKSSGSFIILDNLLEKGYTPLDYRFMLLGGHYRTQLNFSFAAMDTAKAARKSLNTKIAKLISAADNRTLEELKNFSCTLNLKTALELIQCKNTAEYLNRFTAAIEQDLQTPKAISELQAVLKDKTSNPCELLKAAAAMDSVLGLNLIDEALSNDKEQPLKINEEEISLLIKERQQAKAEKNYQKADEIRNRLKSEGIILEDTPSGTIWKQA